MASATFSEHDGVAASMGDDHVATVELRRPPNNFFDVGMIRRLADLYEALAAESDARVIVLCAAGKHFCAGADFSGGGSGGPTVESATAQSATALSRQTGATDGGSARPGGAGATDGGSARSGGAGAARRGVATPDDGSTGSGSGAEAAIGGAGELYGEAIRLFAAELPVVAAVQGAAIGGGLGLACSADFRVAAPEARFAASFARLGFHHGFALTATLPAIVGQQHALDLLYTGRRVHGDEAHQLGLADRLVDAADIRAAAHELAAGIAASAPLAVRSIRSTMRAPLVDAVRRAVEREAAEQGRLRQTADFREGVRASLERRQPRFTGE